MGIAGENQKIKGHNKVRIGDFADFTNEIEGFRNIFGKKTVKWVGVIIKSL